MKKLISIFGLIFVLLLMTSAISTEPTVCCGWNPRTEKCGGSCGGGLVCMGTGPDSCKCSGAPPVPEFVTPAIAMAILLSSPAFAYLIIRRRH